MPNTVGSSGAASGGDDNTPSNAQAAGANVIDAGAAPIEAIQRAQALSGAVKEVAPRAQAAAKGPEAKPEIPLNPLRAGAARAVAAREAMAAQAGDAAAPADQDGGAAPKLPGAKKPAARAPTSKAARASKGKR